MSTASSEHDRREEALQREEHLRLALQAADAGAWSVNLLTGVVFWSDEYMSLYGYDSSSPRTFDHWISSIHPDDRERMRAEYRERLDSGDLRYRQEFRIRHPERGTRWVLGLGLIKRDEQGRAVRLSGIDFDVTKRKEAEDALRDSEIRFRTLAEAVPAVVWASLPDGRLFYVNQRWFDYSGLRAEQIHGLGWADILHPDDRDRTLALWMQSTTTGKNFEGEARYRRHDGVYHWHYFKGVPLRDSDGGISAWYGISLDIERQKNAENLLRESETRFRSLADAAPTMLWTSEPDGYCTFVSQGWLEYSGQSEEEALGFGWLNAIHPEDRERSELQFKRANERHESYEDDCRVRRADGEYRWVIDAGRPRFSGSGEFLGLVGSVVDVHERKQAEQTLRESEERFRTLADNMSQLAWMADPNGAVFWFNRRWYEYTGTAPEDVTGWGWTQCHHPDHLERVLERFRHCWETGEVWEDTFPLRAADGSYRWFLSRAEPIRDSHGGICRWFGTNTDITEQRAAEEALKESDRRKDEFLATLAHELRNPLAPLRNGLEILRMASDNPASMAEARAMMERQLGHLVHLIDDLLDLSRISRGKISLRLENLDITQVVEQAVETCQPAIEEGGHKLTITNPAQALHVTGDVSRLTQVFSNLLSNAAKFTPKGGEIALRTEQAGDEVVIRVRDNGEGIPAHILPKVFEMFTQGASVEDGEGGLGIGLSLVKGLVDLHGGKIEARSDGRDRGSEFIVRLPLAKAQAESAAEAPPKERENHGRRVLVVDDNRDAAISTARMLDLMGNETKTASDGLEAMDMAADFHPEVILLDIGMPGLSGYQVAHRIRQQEWGRNVILAALTGWGQAEDRRRTSEAGFDFHLVKPVEVEALRKVLLTRHSSS